LPPVGAGDAAGLTRKSYGQILVGNPLLLGHRHQTRDQVLELADVARPPVRRQDLQRGLGDALHVAPVVHVVAAQEEVGELGQILDAIAQRRHADRE
jgi:hypothetical protein